MGQDTHCFLPLFLVLTFAYGLIFCRVQSQRSPSDVLHLLSYFNASEFQGYFHFTQGFHSNSPAILLEDPGRNLAVPDSAFRKFVHMFQGSSDISFLANVKQEVGDSGSVFSVSSEMTRFLEIELVGSRDEIRFHYTHDQASVSETFPYRLANNMWHRLAIHLSGTQLTLYVNCSQIYHRVIRTVDRTSPYLSSLNLYVGQRNRQHALFRGALQDVQVVTQSHGYLLQCPQLDTTCPTCSQFQSVEQRLKHMYSLYQNLSLELDRARSRIESLEQCECSRSCRQNGVDRKEGETWETDPCTTCICQNGTSSCRKVDCPPVECDNPEYRDGECCPVCLARCFFQGNYYLPNDTVRPKACVHCRCNKGNMECEHMDVKKNCPPLDCEEQIMVHNECCPICKDTDFCSLGHNCGPHSTCINAVTRYYCQCDVGFKQDGEFNCTDFDECLNKGGKFGHHCYGDTKCVNTIGSYTCRCPNGHEPNDHRTCEDYDVCSEDENHCDEHAECLRIKRPKCSDSGNSRDCSSETGSEYRCICQEGYSGDGHFCHPICDGPCLNGGKCIKPNVCQCRHGNIGMNCELDIDECDLGISSCHGPSVCINTPGSYRCDCTEGFHSSWPDNRFGSLCMDINECSGEGQGHSCHGSTECHNTEGSYECHCLPGKPCLKNCIYEGKEHTNGAVWAPSDKCLLCRCKEGVARCHKAPCDCTSPDVDKECCAHCDVKAKCRHQEVPILFNHGERWLYECHTCECMDGKIDCWPLHCPMVTCAQSIQEPEDCCPRCADEDPCSADYTAALTGADNSARHCLYKGMSYNTGDNWWLEADRCTRCECKGGHICCHFNQTCSARP